jgi:hypothetical protein
MKEAIEKECFDKHIDMEIAYKQQFIDCGDDIQKGFTAGYIQGLQFAKIVVENNSKREE